MQYYTLLLMTSGGVLGMVLTGDIFNMYIMVEILTIGAVGLTAYRSKSEGALEAAFKYLVVGSIGSAFILTAIVINLGVTYDSTGLSKNQRTEMFVEDGYAVGKRGYESRLLTIPVAVNGQVGARVQPTLPAGTGE